MTRATSKQGQQLTIEGSDFSWGKPQVIFQPQGQRFSQLSDEAYDTLRGIVLTEYGQLQSLIDLPNAQQMLSNDSRMLDSGEEISRTTMLNDGGEEYGYTLSFQADDTKDTIPVGYVHNLLHNVSHSFELWARKDGSQPLVTEPAFERIRRQNIQEIHTAAGMGDPFAQSTRERQPAGRR